MDSKEGTAKGPEGRIGNLLKKELAGTLSFTTALFALCFCLVVFSEASKAGRIFLAAARRDSNFLERDFRKLALSYADALDCVRTEIRDLGRDKESLRKYFASARKSLRLDRSTIGAIIVCGTDGKITYSDAEGRETPSPATLAHRPYWDLVRSSPDAIVFGNVVTGISTKKPAVPVAIGFRDANGIFSGAVVFSVSLEGLSQNLSKSSLVSVSIEDAETKGPKPETDSPAFFFLKYLLFASNPTVSFETFEEYSGKFLLFRYGVKEAKSGFLFSCLVDASLLSALLSILAYFYYFRILKPLAPFTAAASRLPEPGVRYYLPGNLFRKINALLSEREKVLVSLKEEIEERSDETESARRSAGSLAAYLGNGLEILAEDVADLRSEARRKTGRAERGPDLSKKIENIVIDTGNELTSLTRNFLKNLESLKRAEKKMDRRNGAIAKRRIRPLSLQREPCGSLYREKNISGSFP